MTDAITRQAIVEAGELAVALAGCPTEFRKGVTEDIVAMVREPAPDLSAAAELLRTWQEPHGHA